MKDQNPFKLKSSKPIYENPWIKVREDAVVRPGGQDGIFGVVEVKEGVAVAALTSDNTLLMAREYKYGVGRFTLECIGGVIDEGEDHAKTAKRELKEEMGAVSNNWTYLGYTVSLPTILTFTENLYLAQDVEVVAPQNTDEGEVIEIVEVPFTEALEKITSGEIIHDTTIVAILRTHLLLNQ